MTDARTSLVDLRDRYVYAILQGQRRLALQLILGAQESGHSMYDIYVDVFQEALYEVGRRWETNIITVADEHMATAITQYVMSHLYQGMAAAGQSRGNAVITGIQGELHQVGANMVADALETRGWNVVFLGTDVPSEGVVETVARHKATLLGISATMFFNIPKVEALVQEIRQEYGVNAPRIVLGGGAFRWSRSLPGPMKGLSVATDLRQAVTLLEH